MLLLEVLATQLKRWPIGVKAIYQGKETGHLYDAETGLNIKPRTHFDVATDAGIPGESTKEARSRAMVYRAEWQARRRELAAETEQASPAPELSTAQRLKKSSAEEVRPVQMVAFNPHHHTLTISGRGHSMGAPEKPFEPLDFSGPVRDYSLKTPSPMPGPMTPIQWLSMDGAWKDGVYVGTVYGRIAVGCDLTQVVGWVASGEIRLKPSMLLADLLALHWPVWPDGINLAAVRQRENGEIHPDGSGSGAPLDVLPLAIDHLESSVSFSQWALAVNSQGFGGKAGARKGWNEQGLPLKGTTCEYNTARAESPAALVTVHVKYSSASTVVFDCIAKPDGIESMEVGREYSVYPCPLSNPFRAIRSPAQISADEQNARINDMLSHDSRGGMLSRRDFCIELIKSGYAPRIESDISRTATLAKLSEAYLQGASDHRGGLEAIYDHGFRLLAPNS